MKWLITFLIGAASGVGALLIFLNMTPLADDAAPWPVAVTSGTIMMQAPPLNTSAPTVDAAAAEANMGNLQQPAPLPELLNAPATIIIPPSVDAAAVAVQNPPAAMPGVVAAPPVQNNVKLAEKLLIPVAGIKAGQLRDTFDQIRGPERRHEAIDIMAPTGTKVFAVADGKVVKLFNSKQGGLTAYQFDATEKYAFYYAHLDQYAPGFSEGSMLKRGDLIGYVGYTGNANPSAPHLHFAIFELGPEKQWWKGAPINPFPLFQD